MSIKISELTPKGANLEATDLLEISESTADGYSSKSITGAEIITAAQEGLQPTLVSGTNIKTINGNSLLGSGDLVISTGLTIGTTAIASGTVGRVLFQGTGNVLQQSTNLFWDNTNGRLGIGTASPSNTLSVSGTALITSNGSYGLSISRSGTSGIAQIIYNSTGVTYLGSDSSAGGFLFTGGLPYASYFGNGANYPTQFGTNGATRMTIFGGGNVAIGTTTDAGYKLDVNGTSVFRGTLGLIATTAIQLAVTTNGNTRILSTNNDIILNAGSSTIEHSFGTYSIRKRMLTIYGDANANAGVSIGVDAVNVASAILSAESTTKGFLPPRMTTTQKNAIATPAAGLVVYDTTLNKLCVYTTAWETITSA